MNIPICFIGSQRGLYSYEDIGHTDMLQSVLENSVQDDSVFTTVGLTGYLVYTTYDENTGYLVYTTYGENTEKSR